MGINFSSFSIRGIDVSEYNGKIGWQEVDNLSNFAVIRVGYGNNIDPNFTVNVEAALKTTLDLAFYWYGDYYSNWFNKLHPAFNLTDEQWGRLQAETCYNAIKKYGIKRVFLDIENITYASFPKLTETKAKQHAMAIFRAFLERMDELTGQTTGIYASLGWISWFDDWFVDRPLWVAWYPFRTYEPTADDVLEMVARNGWTGKCLIWQYASDGDVDDNGMSDGKTIFKTELKEMDLNGWVGTVEQYNQMFSTNVEIPDPIDTPDDEVIVIPPTNTRVIQIKEATRTLTLRKKPLVSWLTQIRTYPAGTKFDCLEKVTVNGNTWQRVGIDQYIADTYDGIQYLK